MYLHMDLMAHPSRLSGWLWPTIVISHSRGPEGASYRSVKSKQPGDTVCMEHKKYILYLHVSTGMHATVPCIVYVDLGRHSTTED